MIRAFMVGWMIFLLYPLPASAGDKVALVIANGKYRNVPALTNPPADAALISAALRKAGFSSIDMATDLDQTGMDQTLRAFGVKARGADVALVYYAGHGIESGGRNFLIPVDATLPTALDLDIEATPLDRAMRMVQGAKLRIILLDACRQNPFTAMQNADQGRSIGRGLQRVEPPEQTLVMYAAKEGMIAADGKGANSPFATALASRLAGRGVPVNRLFRQVRDDVIQMTANAQQPVIYDQTSAQDIYFLPVSGSAIAETTGRRPTGERPAVSQQIATAPTPPAGLDMEAIERDFTSASLLKKQRAFQTAFQSGDRQLISAAVAYKLCASNRITLKYGIPPGHGPNSSVRHRYFLFLNGLTSISLNDCKPDTPAFGARITGATDPLKSLSEGSGTLSNGVIALSFNYKAGFVSARNTIACEVRLEHVRDGRFAGAMACRNGATETYGPVAVEGDI